MAEKPANTNHDRFAHSVQYEQNTSEIKDDILQLAACLKSGQGPLTRQEAGFLLWHHALSGPDMQEEMVANNVVGACLLVLDSPDSSTVEKTCTSGIVMTLCEGEDLQEAVAKSKGGITNCCAVLHMLLLSSVDLVRQYSTKALRLLVEHPGARAILLKCMEQHLFYAELYRDVLLTCHDGHTVTHLCAFLKALLHQREDLKGEAINEGLVEVLLSALQYHKMDSTASALGSLLLLLLADNRVSWGRIYKAGGLPILVDLLGPPPQALLAYERQHWRHLVDPAYANELKRKAAEAAAQAQKQLSEQLKAAQQEKLEGQGAADAAAADTKADSPRSVIDGPQSVRSIMKKSGSSKCVVDGHASVRSTSPPPSSHVGQSRQELEKNKRQAIKEEAEAKAELANVPEALPDPPLGDLLSLNACGLKWGSLSTMPTFSAAAGCLYQLAQNTDYMHEMSRRLAANRLVPLLIQVMTSDDGKKKKPGKKKGLALSPEQVEALAHITGCLKFLSLVNLNKYRIAKLGSVKHLVTIYQESNHTLLRRNAQVLLSNMALLAENGQVLLEGKLPEEFLVPVPMRLTPEEVTTLLLEFPGCGLGGTAAAGPAGAGAAAGAAGGAAGAAAPAGQASAAAGSSNAPTGTGGSKLIGKSGAK